MSLSFFLFDAVFLTWSSTSEKKKIDLLSEFTRQWEINCKFFKSSINILLSEGIVFRYWRNFFQEGTILIADAIVKKEKDQLPK